MISSVRNRALLSSPFTTTRAKQSVFRNQPVASVHLTRSISQRSPHHFEYSSSRQGTTTTANMTTYNINITSDIVCPWCYVGHARLSKAIANHKASHPDDKFNLTYRPFYLSPPTPGSSGTPAFPVKSQPKAEYMANKFGAARAQQMNQMLEQTAKAAGLSFKFGGRVGSSRNGHRLIHYAQTHGQSEEAQNKTILGLWRRYFEQEIDITELDVLVEVGVEAGLGDPDDIRTYLISGREGDAVDQIAEEARLEGISGVPFYLIQDQWAVEGAQEPKAFEQLFLKWKEFEKKQASASNGPASKGESC